MDAAVMSVFCRQRRPSPASCAGLQPRQFPAHFGDAGAGGPLVDPEGRAPTVAHIIVVLDEPRPLGGVGGLRVVDRHLISRPDLATRNADGESRNRGDLLITLNDGLSNCV